MKNLLWLFALIFVGLTNISLACTRFEFGVPIQAEFTRADAVFIGKAIKTKDLRGKDDYEDNGHALRVQFRVQHNFKGAEKQTLTLVTSDWRAACGLEIKKGQTWIIYANYDDEDKVFTSYHGNKYDPIKDKKEIGILKAAAERKTDSIIGGQLVSVSEWVYRYEPVEITIEGSGSQQIVMTKSDGTFILPSLTAGDHRVIMKFPFRASLEHRMSDRSLTRIEGVPTTFEYKVKLKQGDYDFSFFEVIKY